MEFSTLTGLIFLAASLVYLLYRSLLPRPIAGIPHNKDLGLFGDIPALLKWQSNTQEIYSYLTAECTKLGSPIVQLFLRPFGRPWIIICDPEVAREALTRRGNEFDRSAFFADSLHGVIPYHHVRLPTNEQMKAQRRMMNETMSPSFLENVAAPSIVAAMVDLMELWKLKAREAGSVRVFQADMDIKHAVLDAIWSVALGSQAGTMKAQREAFQDAGAHAVQTKSPDTKIVTFEEYFELPAAYKAMGAIGDSVEAILSSPFPKTHHWILRQFPSLREVFNVKERLMNSSLQAALERARADAPIKSAADLILGRALKSGTANIDSPIMRDELFGFMVAGHDTSATTVAWGVKYLSDNPAIQEKLRQHLRKALPHTKVPTAADMVRTNVPYLDAVVEEIARCSGSQSAVSRVTTKDVRIMDVVIPKGADVFFMTNGAGFRAPPFPSSDLKDKTSTDSQSYSWPTGTHARFWPERWLVSKADGEHFVPDAGPSYPFGGGFRGCFGQKMARLEIRSFVAILVCSFELLELPQELGTYAAADKLNHHPQQCFLRLREIV